MEKLSIEEKAKAYDEALERAKEQLEGAKVFDYEEEQIAHDIRTTAYAIFPELKEPEDEKAMEDLLNFLKSPFIKDNICDWKIAPWIAWIEKQKPIQNINKEDEEVRQYIIRIMEQKDLNVPMVQRALTWLSKQGV